MDLKFDEKGLVPAIVQDHYTKEVLTLAYMNAETLAQGRDQRQRPACGVHHRRLRRRRAGG